MKNKLKILSIIVLLITILHFALLMIRGNSMSDGEDWVYWLYFIILIFILTITLLIKDNKMKSWTRGLLTGSIIGGGITSLLISINALFRYSQIMSDGTMVWINLQVPIVILGYPAIIIGAIIGSIVGKIKSKEQIYQ